MQETFLNARRTNPPGPEVAASPAALPSEEQERALIHRVAAKDRQAFEMLYRQYAPRLYRYLSKLIGQPDLVEEVLDDVMVVVWQSASRFDSTAKLSTWILGIAHYKALKARAKLTKQSAESLPAVPEWSHANNPEELLKHQDLQRELARALEHLSPEQRAVVELTFHQECTYQEIATIMGCPVNTVKTRMWHARQYLMRAFAGLRSSRTPASGLDRPSTADKCPGSENP
jgi:RNA polymerase sigma factor (sigma-70 family)